MITAEFKGHKLSNGASAIAFYYPELSGGHDMLKDLKSQNDPDKVDSKIIFIMYAAFRKAGDPEAREKTKEELVDEINVFDAKSMVEFNSIMNKLLSESSGTVKKG